MATAATSLFTHPGVGVRVSDLAKRYRMAAEEVHALKGVRWEVPKGEAVAIMGPSGCGKTTLLNLLGGMDRPTSGQVLVDNAEVGSMNERALEGYRLRKVGFVFQFYNLIPSVSAVENVELPMAMAGIPEAQSRERALELLDIVGLKSKAQKRPEELSGGEQQRVAICLALANDPQLILADEPTGNLDSANADIVAKFLVSLATDFGKTVVMVSHDQNVVSKFPTAYAMRDGKFVQ
jgi:putative ABC transport system ATP-binding protein